MQSAVSTLAVLEECAGILKDREGNYRDPAPMFKTIGYIRHIRTGQDLTPVDAALDLALFKIARYVEAGKRDDLLDAINYLAIAVTLKDRE